MNTSHTLTEEQILDALHTPRSLFSEEEVAESLSLSEKAFKLSSAARDVLAALHYEGPLDDGDVPSKRGRDELLAAGFCAKVVIRGEQGGNACTYTGASALTLIRLLIDTQKTKLLG